MFGGKTLLQDSDKRENPNEFAPDVLPSGSVDVYLQGSAQHPLMRHKVHDTRNYKAATHG